MATPYNPLDKGNLGVSVREALLKRPVLPLLDLLVKSKNRYANKFLGAGIYAIYYTGDFPTYKSVADQNRENKFAAPIYVGKAVPEGARKGGLLDPAKGTDALFDRLKIHAQSIDEVSNIELKDFHFRYLVVDDIWIPLGETYMIEKFQPVWNKKIDGFGNKTPGERRKTQFTSLWDTVHPGRHYVGTLSLPPNPKTAEQILKEIQEYLVMPEEEKAKLPVVDDGGPADSTE
ncbi:MAG TPA: Eco29kI family restriction endonuclease [Bryobacteraceae bacterium]|nr:Eco29kI family restriction endonuclease [Bryobacteraceae bacterium]